MLTDLVPSAVDLSAAFWAPTLSPQNLYPLYFRTMHETVDAAQRNAVRDRPAPVRTLRFSSGCDKDPRTYSLPSSAEVACVAAGEGPLPEHFVSVYERSDTGSVGTTHKLSYLSEHIDPLVYSLMHVDSTLGYSTALHIPLQSRDTVIAFGR